MTTGESKEKIVQLKNFGVPDETIHELLTSIHKLEKEIDQLTFKYNRANKEKSVAYSLLRNTSDDLIKSENRYKIVVDHVKEVLFTTDREGYWIFLNPAWTEITGLTLSTGNYTKI